ncbi:MAG: C39 family peptidase [Candidatus Paceibacterota bacterium]
MMPYNVPLYSQITDISSVEWRQKGCGVADLAMLIEYYKPNTTSVDEVLREALAGGAYQNGAGWKHDGLAAVAAKHGLVGKTFDLTKLNKEDSLDELKSIVKEGPAVASIRRGFAAQSPYGHLIVVTGFDNDSIYYNDPGKRDGIRKVPITTFMQGWKKRLIVVRPPTPKTKLVLASE